MKLEKQVKNLEEQNENPEFLTEEQKKRYYEITNHWKNKDGINNGFLRLLSDSYEQKCGKSPNMPLAQFRQNLHKWFDDWYSSYPLHEIHKKYRALMLIQNNAPDLYTGYVICNLLRAGVKLKAEDFWKS
jgi:hypothetical protein